VGILIKQKYLQCKLATKDTNSMELQYQIVLIKHFPTIFVFDRPTDGFFQLISNSNYNVTQFKLQYNFSIQKLI